MRQPNQYPKVVLEEAYKFQFEKMTMWEEKLSLVIKPKPKWCPLWFYNRLVKMVFEQRHAKGGANVKS